MASLSGWLFAGLAVLVSTQSWGDDGVLVTDHRSIKKVIRVFSDGKIESVFPPLVDGVSAKWKQVDQVAIAPNQKFIAYRLQNDIWLFDVTKKISSRLTSVGKPYTKQFASVEAWVKRWSPDGGKLIYKVVGGDQEDPEGYTPVLRAREAEYGQFVYDLQSGNHKVIVFPDWREEVAAWLANGDFLWDEGGQFVRYTPSTGKIVAVSPKLGSLNQGQIDINRDGSQMVFLADPSYGMRSSVLVKLDLKNGEVSNITPVGQFTEFQWPRFSPSGKRITYWRRVGSGSAYMPLVQSVIDGKSFPQERAVRLGNVAHNELVVDGKSIYTHDHASKAVWIDDSTLAAMVGNAGQIDLVIIDANSGAIKATHKWE